MVINFVSIVMNELCFICWSVWKQHGNTVLFEGKRKNVMLMGSKAVAAFKEFYRGKPQCQGSQLRRIGDPVFMTGWAIGFFDRVSQDWFQKYEAGAVRIVEDGKQYKIQLNWNQYQERVDGLMALVILLDLKIYYIIRLQQLQIYYIFRLQGIWISLFTGLRENAIYRSWLWKVG